MKLHKLKDSLKWYSTYGLAAVAAVPTVWIGSEDLQELLSPEAMMTITPIIAVLTFIGRLIKQTKKELE